MYTVFFIDDEYDGFLNLLTDLAGQKEMQIIPFYSVELAMDALHESGGCDGIILDLTFPEGKMQGKEGLKMIRDEYPGLPVIILTASYNSADITTAVECIKMGALHYIGKDQLNPVALIEQIGHACKSYLKQRIETQKSNLAKGRSELPETRLFNSGKWQSFAFKLEHVSEPSSSKLINYQKRALTWHKNFFQVISFSYLQNATVELIYKKTNSNHLIRVYLIFTVHGNGLQSRENISHLYNDVSPLFVPSKKEDNQIYFFSMLKSGEIGKLKEESCLFQNKTQFKQQLDTFKFHEQVGFKTSHNNHPLLKIPIVNFPDTEDINSFLQLFSKLEFNGELSVLFQPKLLEFKERKLLGLVAQKKIVAETDDALKTGEAVKNARLLNDNYLSLFQCSMVLRSQDNAILTHDKFRFSISTSFDKSPYNETDMDSPKQDNSVEFNYYCPYSAIASFRLPFPNVGGIPGVKSLNINTVHLPDIHDADGGINLGIKNRLGEVIPINILPEDLRLHLYVMGQTGTGKSTLLKSIINSLIRLKKGFCLIDPHGDLAREAQNLIKGNPEAQSKLVVLNPTDTQCDVKLNFLEYDVRFPEQKSLVVNEFFKVFEGLYDMRATGGPIFEQYFKFGMLALLARESVQRRGFPTLNDFNHFYYDAEFRNSILRGPIDSSIREFFKNAIEISGDASFTNIAPYITSKLNRLATDFYLSKFMDTKKSNLDLRDIMDSGKTLIVNLDKGKLGSENVTLFGQLLINKINLAGMGHSEISQSERDDFYLIIDEFQNFSRGDISGSLSELRKYGIIMVLANQTMWQLEHGIANSVLGNIGNLIFFRPGIKDYELLKYYLEPEFTREDVLKLGNYNCIARLMFKNVPSDPFIFQTKPIE